MWKIPGRRVWTRTWQAPAAQRAFPLFAMPFRPGLVTLTAIVALVTGLLLASLHWVPPDQETFVLPLARRTPKLKKEKKPVPALEEPLRLALARAEETPTTPPELPHVPPSPNRAVVSEPHRPPSDTHQGDAAVPKYTVEFFLTLWFASLPGSTAQADETAAQTADRLQKLERNVNDLKEDVRRLADAVASANHQLKAIAAKPAPAPIQPDLQEIKSLNEQIASLKTELLKIKVGAEPEPRRSFAAPSAPALGQIRLVNHWMEPVAVVIDGVSHRLRIGEVKNVNKEVGTFTYEVLGIQPPVTRAIASTGRPFEIRVHPQ